MCKYIWGRLVRLLLICLALITLTFLMQVVIPGDAVDTVFGQQQADPQAAAALRHEFGFDQPLPIQYGIYIANIVHGDLGKSLITRRPVRDEIADRYTKTLLLAVAGLAVALLFGVGSGLLTVWLENKVFGAALTFLNVILLSMPPFWLGLLLLDWFSVRLKWVPVLDQNELVRLILPALTLGLVAGALLSRVVKAELVEVMRQDYITTATAKGLSRRAILLRHALKNALTPVLTLIGLQFGGLLGGAIIIENVFTWPGLGQLAVQAINQRDYPILQGLILLTATTYVLVNTGVDILYHWLDPRMKTTA